jgi:hypothetical protein
MAYEVNKTDGSILLNIQEGEVDTTYGLNLLGKNYLGYGELIAENFVKLLENFSSTDEPNNPIPGQLWFSLPTTAGQPKQLKVFHGSGVWKPLGHVFVGSEPSLANRSKGDMWFDTANQSLLIWSGSRWIHLSNLWGPPGQETGMIVNEPIKCVNGNLHRAIKFKVNGVLTAVFSSDAAYTPAPAGEQIDGYNYTEFCGGGDAEGDEGDYNNTGKIGKGVNLNSSSDFKIRGVAIEAEFADVAEIYVGDAAYEPGTLVGLGGAQEITSTKRDADTSIFGVVSTRPAYLLNARKKYVKNALPIAVAGRIPVKVQGSVHKGDRLVASATPGVARSATEADPIWSVIGRSLQDWAGEGIGKVEATVGVR